MKAAAFLTGLGRGRLRLVSTLRLWLVFLAFAGGAALLIAGLQRVETVLPPAFVPNVTASRTLPVAVSPARDRPPVPGAVFATTFAEAAESLRTSRFPEAYGRFVALADEGDVNAARFALLMHRYGPEVFGSTWDASQKQLEEWTRWSEAAARQELAQRGLGSTAYAPAPASPALAN